MSCRGISLLRSKSLISVVIKKEKKIFTVLALITTISSCTHIPSREAIHSREAINSTFSQFRDSQRKTQITYCVDLYNLKDKYGKVVKKESDLAWFFQGDLSSFGYDNLTDRLAITPRNKESKTKIVKLSKGSVFWITSDFEVQNISNEITLEDVLKLKEDTKYDFESKVTNLSELVKYIKEIQ